MTSKLATLCDACKHLRKDGFSCAAFPSMIPEEIRVWAGDHRKRVPGQAGTTVFQAGNVEKFKEWKRTYGP